MNKQIEKDTLLKAYLDELKDYDVLPLEDELKIREDILAGDEEAYDKLINSHLRFVVNIAKKYQNNGLTLHELINIGNVGLVIASRKFDYENKKDIKFITYAVWWIRQSILFSLNNDSRLIRIPTNITDENRKIEKSGEKVEKKYNFTIHSIDETYDDSNHSIFANLSLDEEIDAVDDNISIEMINALSKLTKRQYNVITLFFGLNNTESLTLNEIGKLMGLSSERVRQIKNRAIEEIRYEIGGLF